MFDDDGPQRPTLLWMLAGLSLLIGLALVACTVWFFTMGSFRIALILTGVPALAMIAGAFGLLTDRHWGRQRLTVGLVIGSFNAALVLIFGLIVGQGGTFSTVMNVGSGVASVALLGMVFLLHTATVSQYLWAIRMPGGEALDDRSLEVEKTTFDFGSDESEVEEASESVEQERW